MLLSGEPVDGLLRRRKLRPASQKLYMAAVTSFAATYSLGRSPAAGDVDECLDRELVQLWLMGEDQQALRVLFYAVKWYWTLQLPQLSRSHASLQGAARDSPDRSQEPETWEATLLMCVALLTAPDSLAPASVRATAVVGYLLSFDLYARAMSLVQARRSELRPPQPVLGSSAAWSLTLWPLTGAQSSKTRTFDDFAFVGATNPARLWLASLCQCLWSSSSADGLLLGLTPAEYRRLFHAGRRLARLPPSTPHRLRHGGASADGALGVSDCTIADRGHWAAIASVRRYRTPARYLRQLELLSRRQRVDASAAPATIQHLVAHYLRRGSVRR